MQDIKVTLVQPDLRWEDRAANLSHLEELIKSSTETADLVVLPETFTTGFSMEVRFAETMDGEAMQWMARLAKETGSVITGSLMMKEGGKYYNRLVWMRPDGSHEQYDKRHLFGLGKETEYYTPGTERKVFELKGWRICPQVCYDLRFPVWIRNRNDYDLLIFVANWPEVRRYAWQHLLIARAIENLSYVIGVSRIGLDGHHINHTGDSAAIDPLGKVLFTEENKELVKTVTLSAAYLREVRDKLPFLGDGDEFSLNRD
jgi:predicted amidohydrolase